MNGAVIPANEPQYMGTGTSRNRSDLLLIKGIKELNKPTIPEARTAPKLYSEFNQ